jgi:succinylglutamic semialdehyde dehydrogenase
MLKDFCEELLSVVQKLQIGPTDDVTSDKPGPFMGPLYSEKAVEKFLRFQTMANREAKETLLWGKALDRGGGFFVTPGIHLMNKLDSNSAYQSNVLFCPDVAIYVYDTLEEAIEWINTTDASFAVSFFGAQNILEERRRQFLAPNLLINLPTVEIEASLPLSGRLQSGHHRYNGPALALLLAYPQIITSDPNQHKVLERWPWSH